MPAGTVVLVTVLEALSSQTAKRGDHFAIELAQPIRSEEGVLIPAGARGVGEVVSAAKPQWSGQPGELVLAARYIEYGGQQIPLRALKLGGAGRGSVQATNLCKAIFTYCSAHPSNVEVPPGTVAEAKLGAELTLPVLTPAPAPPVTEPSETP